MNHYSLRQSLTPEVIADPHALPLCLRSIVQYMTEEIPVDALPFARWEGVPVLDPPCGGKVIGHWVYVMWPEVECA